MILKVTGIIWLTRAALSRRIPPVRPARL